MRFVKGFILLILAAALIVGACYAIDLYPDVFGRSDPLEEDAAVDVASRLTGPIYGLETSVSEQVLTDFGEYEVGLDKEIVAYLKKHGGGKYVNAEGETVTVASSSGSGGSSGGGGSYYYDDDDDDYWYDGGGYSGGGDSSGGGGSSGGGWTEVDVYVDDTEYNICHICGYEYIGTGSCPNPACPGNN